MSSTKISDAFKISYSMLKYTGGWPEENSSKLYKLWGMFNYTVSMILAVMMLLEVYADRNDFTKLSETLYIMLMIVAYFFKHGSIFANSDTFVYMIKLLEDPLMTKYPSELNYLMQNRVKFSYKLANSYRVLVFLCLFLIAVSPIIDNKPLPFPFPYELGKFRSVVFIFQVITSSINAWNNSAIDSLTAGLVGVGITELNILAKKITYAVDDKEHCDSKYTINILKECINHHWLLIDYIRCIDKVFSFAVLAQFLSSVMIICNTIFHIVLISLASSQFFLLLSYLAIALFQLFMYCWFGNDIIWNSGKIKDACYECNWYNCTSDVRKYVFIMMERSKKPLKITAYKFSTVSLSAFATIIQWSYSYFALLMNLYIKHK